MKSGPEPPMTVGTVPGRVPVLGHLLALGLHPLEFVTSLPAFGDLVEIGFGPRRAFVVCHPHLVHQVLRDGRTFDKGGPLWEQVRAAIGNGLANCSHEVHKRQRRLVQPSFAPSRILGYSGLMSEQIAADLRSWHDGQTLDIDAEMNEITAKILMQAMFAVSLSPADITATRHAADKVLKGIHWRMIMPARLRWLPIPALRRVNAAVTQLDELIYRIITVYRQGMVDHGDMLSTLIAARDGQGDSLTDQEIRDHLLIFIVGGFDTTAALLAWTLHLLAQHPEVEQRLHAEVDTVLKEASATHDDIPNLQYTGRVLTETLRLYPPGWMFTRTVTTDTHLGGHPLTAGTPLVISPYQLHRRDDHYPHPDRFDPDRWLPENAASLPRGAFIPFSAGPRKCIGDTYGMHEATLILATIAARWRLRPAPGLHTRPRPRTLLRPHPLYLRLQQRHRLRGDTDCAQ